MSILFDNIIYVLYKDNLDSFKRLISNLPESHSNKMVYPIRYLKYLYQNRTYITEFEGETKDKDNKMIPLSGLPFLHISAFFNSLECFKYLHEEKHLPLRSLSEDNFFPLHYACFKWSSDIALYILNKDPEEVTLNPQKYAELPLLYCAVMG